MNDLDKPNGSPSAADFLVTSKYPASLPHVVNKVICAVNLLMLVNKLRNHNYLWKDAATAALLLVDKWHPRGDFLCGRCEPYRPTMSKILCTVYIVLTRHRRN